jgi:hypothetical protein
MRPPVVQNYEVRLADLPHEMDKTVLVALSDLHLGALSANAGWRRASPRSKSSVPTWWFFSVIYLKGTANSRTN